MQHFWLKTHTKPLEWRASGQKSRHILWQTYLFTIEHCNCLACCLSIDEEDKRHTFAFSCDLVAHYGYPGQGTNTNETQHPRKSTMLERSDSIEYSWIPRFERIQFSSCTTSWSSHVCVCVPSQSSAAVGVRIHWHVYSRYAHWAHIPPESRPTMYRYTCTCTSMLLTWITYWAAAEYTTTVFTIFWNLLWIHGALL